MEKRRYIGFAIAIGAGLIMGLIIGWSVFPRNASEMPLKELRMDYKTDYVLMVAFGGGLIWGSALVKW